MVAWDMRLGTDLELLPVWNTHSYLPPTDQNPHHKQSQGKIERGKGEGKRRGGFRERRLFI